jgi:hypothetical protein
VIVQVPIGVVVPGGSAHAKAVALPVDQIEFGEQVEAVGDDRAVAEVAVPVVEVRAGEQGRILRLNAEAQVVADRVVPPHRQIGVVGDDIECAGDAG